MVKKAKPEVPAEEVLEAGPEVEPGVEPVPVVEPPAKAKYYENLFRGGK